MTASTPVLAPPEAAVGFDAVVTHHLDGYRSGVARFNQLLADRVGLPLVGLDRLTAAKTSCPLLSFKVRELDSGSVRAVERWLAAGPRAWEVFLHDYADLELERSLVCGARRVHCGNLEIEARVRRLSPVTRTLWTPSLVVDERAYGLSEISVFSFGMAHKLRGDMFHRLKALLDASGRRYALYVSAANHETSSLRDSEVISRELASIFGDSLYFLGNLSDVAINDWLSRATFFAAFFRGGVRANNTSVAAAMERGAIVITNLDEYSPPEFVHMENVVDLERCDRLPFDPLVMRRVGVCAMETARGRTWDHLVERLR